MGVAFAILASTSALFPRQPSSAEIARALDRLAIVGRVLYVAAHPDDENTRLISWLVHDRQLDAGYLSLTRGEGGQNLIGAEQAPLLGLIRTHELYAARAIDGGEQLLGEERDFGYSKTPEETLRIWGKREALADVVWAVRRFRPDVIVTRFSPEARDTHGHHTVSAMLALEAFSAAADPRAFPEQLALVAPWQTKRIVWNRGVFGPTKPEELMGFLSMDVSGYDAVLGASYGEIAAKSRSMHKSQGFGVSPQRGPALEYFRLLAGEPMQRSFLDGLDTSWARVPGSAALAAALARARKELAIDNPALSVPRLLESLALLDALPDNPWKDDKRAALVALIGACAGLYVDALAAESVANPGGDLEVTFTAINRSALPLTLESVSLPPQLAGSPGTVSPETIAVGKPLVSGQPLVREETVRLSPALPLSAPDWLRASPASAGRWRAAAHAALGEELQAVFTVGIAGARLRFARPLVFAWNDPVQGERRRPLEVLPRVSVTPEETRVLFADGAEKTVRVRLVATRAAASGTLGIAAPKGFFVAPERQAFTLAAGAEETMTLRVRAMPGASATTLTLSLAIDGASATDAARVTRVDHPHIPLQTLVGPAHVELVPLACKIAGRRIGYIQGAGDDVPAALRQVGYDVTILDDAALQSTSFQVFDAVVIGVRAYNTNRALRAAASRLNDYVAGGGTVVAQYSTNNRLGQLDTPIGPWPLNVSQDRVTDENAAVTRVLPSHAVLNVPNVIGDADFTGWVQERGLYFADKWDPRYDAPLGMHDAGETDKRGALLVARHGAGRFVYTGLAFFRQLPAAVPGAFRLFANLLGRER